VRDRGEWLPAIKVSESSVKTPNPGHKLAWRVYDHRGKASADLLSLDDETPGEMDVLVLRHPSTHTRVRTLRREEISRVEPLQVKILDEGKLVYDLPSIQDMRHLRLTDVRCLDPGVRRLMNPHVYHVSLTQRLWDLKQELIRSALQKSQ
jgi:nicotinate phosphoribosyltransferase